MPMNPHRTVSSGKKFENIGKMETIVSLFKIYKKNGEMDTIIKPTINKAAAFLIESFIFFTL